MFLKVGGGQFENLISLYLVGNKEIFNQEGGGQSQKVLILSQFKVVSLKVSLFTHFFYGFSKQTKPCQIKIVHDAAAIRT